MSGGMDSFKVTIVPDEIEGKAYTHTLHHSHMKKIYTIEVLLYVKKGEIPIVFAYILSELTDHISANLDILAQNLKDDLMRSVEFKFRYNSNGMRVTRSVFRRRLLRFRRQSLNRMINVSDEKKKLDLVNYKKKLNNLTMW